MSSRFIVASHGWSASNWVAHSLNMHKDILCTHSAKNIVANDPFVHTNESLKKDINKWHNGYELRLNRSVDSCYDDLERIEQTKFTGTVHVYRLRDLPSLHDKFPFQQPYKVFNLIRNPMSLVWSGYGQFKDLFLYDLNELYWTLKKIIDHSKEFIHEVGNRHHINIGETDKLAFIGACSVLSSLRKDIDAIQEIENANHLDYKGVIKMEEITQNPETLELLLQKISDESINIDDSYFDSVYKLGAINKHKKDSKKITASERFSALEDWQKEVFVFFMKKFNLTEEYSKFGYDLTYL
ncbi:MAG: hypothetical protein NXI20_25515 [bacterium]|nr:hypothetical protein [bacterium]